MNRMWLTFFRPGFWKYAALYLAKRYDDSLGAVPRLAYNGGAVIDPSASFKLPHLISLGKNVRIGDQCFLWPGADGKIFIHDDTLLGPNVMIFSSNHGMVKHMLIRDQDSVGGDVVIGRDCWLGAGTIILSGVTLGEGTIVAAGSVVTKNTPPYSIVAGVPAKVISERV